MDHEAIAKQLDDLDEKLFGERSGNALAPPRPSLDYSRPNIHDSKREFLRELNAVKAIVKHTTGVLDQLIGSNHDDDPEHEAMVSRLRVAIQKNVERRRPRRSLETASDLAQKNLIDSGFYHNSLVTILETFIAYEQRLTELLDQEKQFWSVSHRPPNYYARTIALRFARQYARETRARPTFGISSQGSYPSTEFGRALEKVFEILGIKASVRKAAEWAIDQLTEEDWSPPKNALYGGRLGKPFVRGLPKQSEMNSLAKIAAELEKR